jgi:type 1 fimbria pilin
MRQMNNAALTTACRNLAKIKTHFYVLMFYVQRNRHRVIRILFSLCVLLWSTHAMAVATISFSQGTLAFSPAGPYSLAVGQAVGSTIANASIGVSANNFTGNCSLVQTLQVIGSEISPGSGIYTTGLNGIGVRFYLVPAASGRIQLTGVLPVAYPSINLSSPGALAGIAAEIVLTGPVLSGLLSSLPSLRVSVASAGLADACAGLTGAMQTLQTTVANNAVTATSCQVLTSSLSVKLPNISNSMLNAVGTTTGDTRFSIELNCQAGVSVFMTLTDATSGGNTTGLLSLKPASTATGVKLRILKSDGSVIRFGPDSPLPGNINQWLVGSSGTTNNIALTVQYYRDGETIGNGSIEAAATFTLSYQ